MSIQFSCTGCGKRHAVKEVYAGKRAKCPACGRVTTVPGASAPRPVAVLKPKPKPEPEPEPDAYGLAEEPPEDRPTAEAEDDPAAPSEWANAAAGWWKSALRNRRKKLKRATLLGVSGSALWLFPGVIVLLFLGLPLSTPAVAWCAGMVLAAFSALILLDGMLLIGPVIASEGMFTWLLIGIFPLYIFLYSVLHSDRPEVRSFLVSWLIGIPAVTLATMLILLGSR